MLKFFMRACVFTGFHSLFLGFCHISGSSARLPLFFGCFSDFAAFSMIFCPYALFRQKIAYSLLLSAFCGYLRSFNLFHPVFPYNRAFAAVLTDFLCFRCVLRFCPFLRINSVFFMLLRRIYRVLPYLSCIQ